jgi:hypothetical protein
MPKPKPYPHSSEYVAFCKPNDVKGIVGMFSRSQVYRMITAKQITARKVNGATVVSVKEILDLIHNAPSADIEMGRYTD